jgi:23S rRNA (cytosine1962-C5)-methyltransferase
MKSTPRIVLKPGREKLLARCHPWIFSGAIDHTAGNPQSGDTVEIRDAGGELRGRAAFSPQSQIRARIWTFDAAEVIDDAFFRRRLRAALALRRELIPARASTALRLVHGESDGLPGLVVDRYGDTLVAQFLSAGTERWRDTLAALLIEETGCANLYERSDADVRELEGLAARSGLMSGTAPDGPLEMVENGLRYQVDIAGGHKTGFYLDQRDSRRQIGQSARDREVLNCFCYTGGFSIAALAGGARSVLSIDSSGPALALAAANVALNKLDAARAQWLEADVFQALRKLREEKRQFDLIVLDPPKFAPTASFAEKASRGYKDINLNAMRLLRPGGLLATFSCSGGISADLFQKIVAGAAADAGMSANILDRFHAAPDHPVRIEFPEGEYLKGLLLRRA